MINRMLALTTFSLFVVCAPGVVSVRRNLPTLGQSFSEDGPAPSRYPMGFEFSGYARMPIRFADAPLGDRGPDLVDDNYSQSGFACRG